jgi:homoaconitate hydratase
VAVPFAPDNVVPVDKEAGRKLDGAFIGACTTTEEELVLGALVLEAALASGAVPVASANRLVVPGDLAIQRNLREAGLWSVYERAGFTVDPPGCSMCLGVASRKAGKGEVWLSSQNRNFKNRMGEGSLAYLASGATVAASAVGMAIADPRPLLARVDRDRYARLLGRDGARRLPEVTVVEPEIAVAAGATAAAGAGGAKARPPLVGQVQRFGDAIDTDAIIPGEFCHLTSLEELGAKAFVFVKPDFVEKVRGGADIVVAGEGWGSGSSREQAVWALQGAGIRLVVARSFAFIHKRNLVNEALPFVTVEDDEFYRLAEEGATVSIDFTRSEVTVGGRSFRAIGASGMVQGLTRAGGLIPAIRRYGARVFETVRS